MYTGIIGVKSDFSLGESINQVETIVKRAKELGFSKVALTDTMSLSGMVRFTDAAKKEGLTPVIGVTLRVTDDTSIAARDTAGEFLIKAFPTDEKGMLSLMQLLSKGYSEDHFYYKARVAISELEALENVVLTTGDLFSILHRQDVGQLLLNLKQRFPVYVELVPINTPLFDTLNRRAANLASNLSLETVIGHPILYPDAQAADSLDVHRAITTNNKMNSRTLPIPYQRDMHFKDRKELVTAAIEMSKRVPETKRFVKSAIENVDALLAQCGYEFSKMKPSLPKMADDEFAVMVEQCKQGWVTRLKQPVMGYQPDDLQPYRERLVYELGVLKKMGFSGYFLLVQQIVQWAKSNGIMVGPGRGSVGGSLVAYLLGITDVDPIRFKLLFERFINPERLDLPDADLDFMSGRRGEVVEWIVQHFGADNVAGISNYNSMAAAGAMRDVSRVHELDPFDYSASKLVEKVHGISLSLEETAGNVPEIAKFRDKFPHVWKHALKLEGCMRAFGRHAAGVVVGGEPLINRAVVETRTGAAVVNWDKKNVEDFGLIKMDILGLSTLDILAKTIEYVRKRHGSTIDLLSLPLDDKKTMDAFAKGETTGVFQFESPGMRGLLKQLGGGGNLSFDDLVAVVALYRPGPLDAGLFDEYVQITQGAKRPYYEHPKMEEVLKDTRGVIVYQEQVMRLSQVLAGFTGAEADHLRKAMGKKDKDAMAAQRQKWVDGCVSHSEMTEQSAGDLFDKIEVFAGYAFNLSHSVEYSVISYWCQYLKQHYAAEYFAGALSVQDDESKIGMLVMDAKVCGIEVLPPDINVSSSRIEVKDDKTLVAPFTSVKGVSEKTADLIVKTRDERGKFDSFADFEAALKAAGRLGKVNIRVRENLRKVGAFADVEPGEPPANDKSRLKDKIDLMPGYVVDAVKAERSIELSKANVAKVVRIVSETQTCDKCDMKGSPHIKPIVGKHPKFMMVFDSPTYKEVQAGRLLNGDVGLFIRTALQEVGMTFDDGVYTCLVRAAKDQGQKFLTTSQINGCSDYLAQEIDALKPPVIVAMGRNAIQYFSKDSKTKPQDLLGKTLYRQDLDATILFGFNPIQCVFDLSLVKQLESLCVTLSELVSTE